VCSAVLASPPGVTEQEYTWTGMDEFSMLQDRVNAPPLPLPAIREPKRVVLVRHGQSTWNAQGRIQGSSNVSVLTKKGESQAETTQQMVRCKTICFCSKGQHLGVP
jgi:probable phosphoglycerate mutase